MDAIYLVCRGCSDFLVDLGAVGLLAEGPPNHVLGWLARDPDSVSRGAPHHRCRGSRGPDSPWAKERYDAKNRARAKALFAPKAHVAFA